MNPYKHRTGLMKSSGFFLFQYTVQTGLMGIMIGLMPGWHLFGQAVENAKKINKMLVQLQEPKKAKGKELFIVTERELNDFIAAAIEINKPKGLRKMVMNLQDNNNFYARAFIKADEIKLEGIAGKMLAALLQGDQLVEAEGHVTVKDKKVNYELDKTRINGMAIPAAMASELASYVIQERHPEMDLKKPCDLPYGISDVRIKKNSLIVER